MKERFYNTNTNAQSEQKKYLYFDNQTLKYKHPGFLSALYLRIIIGAFKKKNIALSGVFIQSLVLFLLLTGCHSENKESTLSLKKSGIINYKITYTDENDDTVTDRFLPGVLKIRYEKEKLKMHIESNMNIFSINIVSPGPTDSSLVNFHFMGKDFSYKIASSDLIFLYDKHKEPVINIHKEDSLIIAGLMCYKAIVKPQKEKPYEIYYTDKLPVIKPNRHTPLYSIPGMVMSFPIKYKGLNFHISAVSFENMESDKIQNDEYRVNSSNEEVESLIKNLIDIIH